MVLSFVPTSLSEEVDNIGSHGLLSALKINSAFLLGLYFIIFIFYSSIMESSTLQGTFGKWFLRYKVCDTEFKRISFSKALLRSILKAISIFSVIGVFIIDMTPKRQGLHDLVVRTVLIRR